LLARGSRSAHCEFGIAAASAGPCARGGAKLSRRRGARVSTARPCGISMRRFIENVPCCLCLRKKAFIEAARLLDGPRSLCPFSVSVPAWGAGKRAARHTCQGSIWRASQPPPAAVTAAVEHELLDAGEVAALGGADHNGGAGQADPPRGPGRSVRVSFNPQTAQNMNSAPLQTERDMLTKHASPYANI
jgi:hypothetical protein